MPTLAKILPGQHVKIKATEADGFARGFMYDDFHVTTPTRIYVTGATVRDWYGADEVEAG